MSEQTVLTKAETVMYLCHRGAFVGFLPKGALYARINLPKDVWVDMGRPTTITVAVEPGDTLNEEQA